MSQVETLGDALQWAIHVSAKSERIGHLTDAWDDVSAGIERLAEIEAALRAIVEDAARYPDVAGETLPTGDVQWALIERGRAALTGGK